MSAPMTYMEKLLDGVEVEWKRLGEVLIKNIGGGTPSKAEERYWNGTIPWASVGDLSIESAFVRKTRNHITSEGLRKSSSNLVKKGCLIVAVKISPGKIKIADSDIAINQDLRGLEIDNNIMNKYLYYYIDNTKIIGNGTIVKSITSKDLEKLSIPIPPLHIQAEIVRILDSFTALTAELTAELIAELTARKKQYNYYREKLLQFGPEVEWKPLGEVCGFKNGFAFKSSLFKEKGLPIVRIKNIEDYQVNLSDVKMFDPSDYKEDIKPFEICRGTILVAMSGATTGKIGFYDKEQKAFLNQRVGSFLPREGLLNNRYLYHFLLTKEKTIYNIAGGGAQPNLSSGVLMSKLKIPIPPLAEQERIVSILDTFDTLAQSITEGLPREIELRKKQYAYYRDRLLSFPRPKENP